MTTKAFPGKSLSLTYYWVRHGETEANRDGILQGHSDFPLTENGKEGAIKTGVFLSKVKFDHMYTSDLGRATTTASLILRENYHFMAQQQDQSERSFIANTDGNDNDSIRLKTVSLIRELYFGVKENMPKNCSWEQAAERVAQKRGISIEEALQDNEEPFESLFKRTQEFLDLCKEDVMKSLKDSANSADLRIEQNILCVSHSGFISNFLRTLSHYGILNREFSLQNKVKNCSCSCIRLEYTTPDLERPDIFINDSVVNLHEHLTQLEENRQCWPILDPDTVETSLRDASAS